MNQKRELRDNIYMQETFKVEVRETLERHLFDIAVEHTIRAASNVDRDNYLKMQQELKHTLIAIIMSHSSLEALANSIGMEFYGAHPNMERRERWKEIERLPLSQKIKHLSEVAYKHKTDSEEIRTLGKSLNEIMLNLTDLRHSIVHYQAVPVNTTSLSRTSRNEPVSPEINKYTSQVAVNAIGTVKLVIREFNKLARKDYGGWVETILKKHGLDLEIQESGTEFKFNLKY